MIEVELLEQAIKSSGLKKGYIAEQIGLSRAGLSNCLSNRAEFKVSQMRKLSRLLNLTAEQFNSIFMP